MNIEQIARECGLYDDDQEPLTEYLQQFANAILEEAAKRCDEEATCEGIAQRCAEAIRRMKA